MSSSRKIAANWRNARQSTGPQTTNGKGRSKRNALRHGLSVGLPRTVTIAPDVERLASAIARPDLDPCRWHFAVIAADAELELRRVRSVRISVLEAIMPADMRESGARHNPGVSLQMLTDPAKLDRYEQRVLARRDRALRLL